MNEQIRTNPNRKISRARKGLVMAAAGPLILAAACSSQTDKPEASVTTTSTTEAPAPETTSTTTPEISKKAEQQAKETLKPEAMKATLTVLDILEMPGAGAENYKGTYVGNKRALVGEDLQSGTPDDASYQKYPEAFVTFNPVTRTIDLKATLLEGNLEDGSGRFWSVDTAFSVAASNPLLTIDRQLTVADFRQALADEKTELVSASAGVGLNYSGTVSDGFEAGLVFGSDGVTGTLSSEGIAAFAVAEESKINNLVGSASTSLDEASKKFISSIG